MQVKEFENKLDLNTHIGAWYIEPKICDEILQFMNLNKHLFFKGVVGANRIINKKAKESLDITIDPTSYFYPWKNYIDSLHECIKKYTEKFCYSENINRFGICEPYNIQHYNPGGGFKEWHCERDGTFDKSIKRCLVFMTYLNDAENAGTEFFYQKLSLPCKKGLTVIWPSDWTHTHKGIINEKQSKTIVTGWLSHYYENNISK